MQIILLCKCSVFDTYWELEENAGLSTTKNAISTSTHLWGFKDIYFFFLKINVAT